MAANPEFVLLPDPFTDLIHQYPFNAPVESSSATIKFQPFPYSVDLSDEFERQSREVDIFLHLENEKLKRAIQEKRQQQLTALWNSLESVALARMRKTEHELASAMSRKTELEERLRRAEEETEAWKRAAEENEGIVTGLSNMLGQAEERAYWPGASGGPAQDAESVSLMGMVDEDRKIRCKGCRKQRSRVVLMPCRHLCVCGDCGGVFERCPVCRSVKEGYIEVFLC